MYSAFTCTVLYVHSLLTAIHEIGITISILEMRKLKLRKRTRFAQGHCTGIQNQVCSYKARYSPSCQVPFGRRINFNSLVVAILWIGLRSAIVTKAKIFTEKDWVEQMETGESRLALSELQRL